MSSFTITPTVNAVQEFIEISQDFANPLDLVREAISNAFDAQATKMKIHFDVQKEHGESLLIITLADDGHGMNKDGLQAFFDLGNSSRRNDPNTIGEKGHGTKVYFNSRRVEVWTSTGEVAFHAQMDEPYRRLSDQRLPTVEVLDLAPKEHPRGTRIVIRGYNNNRREQFTHDNLKDHVQWFTKFAAFDSLFVEPTKKYTLSLKGLDRSTPEMIAYGHVFPEQSTSMKELFEDHLAQAPDYFCKRIVREGSLQNAPEIRFQAVFSIEGKYVKYEYNKMLRRQGYNPPSGAYRIQDRYGLWLCKDFIPIQRKNDWITTKGSEYTRLHAFVNCQGLRLTANRGSVDNTPAEVLEDLGKAVKAIYAQIVESDDWRELEWLEEEAAGYRSTEKEKKDFSWRHQKVMRANVANWNGHILVEPARESGVFSMFLQLATISPGLFPFRIVDYDTHSGIDVLAKGDGKTPIQHAKLYYVEFKHTLQKDFNHSFANLYSVVCWDTAIKHDEIVADINGEQRKMVIHGSEGKGDYTHYYLDHPKSPHRIQVFVLKDYLREKLELEFRPRTKDAAI